MHTERPAIMRAFFFELQIEAHALFQTLARTSVIFLTFVSIMKYDKHIFICTNQRPPGEKKSCGEECGLGLVKEFKRITKEKGLNKSMRAQRTGCLDACEYGPSLVIYPEGVFYGGVKNMDVAEMVEGHLVNNRVVERLVIKADGFGV